MAKRRKKSKFNGTRRRRSRVSGIGAIDIQNIGGVIAGAVIGGYLNKLIPATVNDKMVAGGKVALGVALPMFVKDGKMKNLVSGMGAGLIAVGSVDLLKSFGMLSGDFDIPVINGDVLAGDEFGADEFGADDDIPVINGDVLAGDVLAGDEEAGMGADEFGADEFGADDF